MKKLALYFLVGFFTSAILAQEAPTPDMLRQSLTKGVESLNIEPEKIFKIENRTVDSIPVRIYYPTADKRNSIIYNVHGGAFVACDLETHENISRKIANATNSIVVAIDYRKPPENPFPQSIDDVYTVYKWILENRVELIGSNKPISLISDSSGSILTAALQVKINDLNEKSEIEKAVYINPGFDLRNPGPYALVTNWYLSGADANSPLASPITSEDFSIFCPSFIAVNEKDILKQQGIDFGKKLDEKDIPNEVLTVMGEDHFGVLWAGAHPKIDEVFEKAITFLNR